MEKILLILSTTRSSPKSIDRAIKLTREQEAELVLLYVLDLELPQSIVRHMAEEGWFGGQPSDDFYDALLHEYEIWGREKIEEIKNQAEAQGIPFRAVIKRGKFLSETLGFIETENVDHVIVTRRRRSNLSRFIFGSAVGELKARFMGKVQVIDE
jgi:nucleotide-binding universal stress UspA family protein